MAKYGLKHGHVVIKMVPADPPEYHFGTNSLGYRTHRKFAKENAIPCHQMQAYRLCYRMVAMRAHRGGLTWNSTC